MTRSTPRRHSPGFTLVELLVVIAIIGMLVGLLLPAIDYAREQARKAQCMNSQRQVAQGMIQFETTKGYFPGRLNYPISGNTSVRTTWAGMAMPYISRGDIWEAIIGTGLPSSGNVGTMICPSDAGKLASTNWPTSFVANAGVPDNSSISAAWPSTDIPPNGTCHDLTAGTFQSSPTPKVSMEYVQLHDGVATTMLLTENVDATSWATFNEWPDCTILWALAAGPADMIINQPVDTSANYKIARPSSNHSGGVNVVFCDGHAIFLRQDIPYSVFVQLLTPWGTQSRRGTTQPNAAFHTPPLSDQQYQ